MTLANLIRKGGLAQVATATPATVATQTVAISATVAPVASVAVAADEFPRAQTGLDDFDDVVFTAGVHATANEAPRRYPPDDDRRHCACCRNLARSGLCLAARRGEIEASDTYHPVDNIPRRCEAYLPFSEDTDQRAGRERWPGLTRYSEQIPVRISSQFSK